MQAFAALKNGRTKSVLGVDVNKYAVKYCNEKIKRNLIIENKRYKEKISFKQSDLFSNVTGKFDTTIFNPPYLPIDPRLKDTSLDGGKHGYEVLEKFLSHASAYLNPNGKILVVFSSLTKKDKVDNIIGNYCFDFTLLEKLSIPNEFLYCYLIEKSRLLNELEKKGIKKVAKLAKGYRGVIFTGYKGREKLAIKAQRHDVSSRTIAKEAKILKKLNKKGIGPNVVSIGRDYFIYGFVEGVFLPEFLIKNKKQNIKQVLKEVFLQCRKLDILGINKEEMHHPFKHVIVEKRNKSYKATLIDFERAFMTKRPHNVTQFCQYITSGKFSFFIRGKGLKIDKNKIRKLASGYKKDMSNKNFGKIIKEIK